MAVLGYYIFMKNVFLMKVKETSLSVFPIIAFIVILNFTPLYSLSFYEIMAFVLGAIILIIGASLFDIGADIAMTPMGRFIGEGLTAKRKLFLLLFVSFVIGVLVTISEPDLGVLANQLSGLINKTVFIVVVGIGVGVLLIVAILKIIFKKSLNMLLIFFHLMLFAVAVLTIRSNGFKFLPLAFDSGGVTTGPITVPFILALGVGISKTLRSRDSKDNSFGLLSLCSVGAVIAILILCIFVNGDISYDVSGYGLSDNVFLDFLKNIPVISKDVGISLGLVVVIFLICQFTFLKLDKTELKKLALGIVLTFVGLVLFLTAVETSFIDIGYKIGVQMAENVSSFWIMVFNFVLGALVVLAEPAIQVLVKQIEDITDGMVTKKAMLIAMAVGVGLAGALSVIRIYFDIDLMYFLVPAYVISFGLSFFIPPIYTAIAFDSGGVATGSLTSSFVLPLMIGVCGVIQGTDAILSDAFGVIALVAVIPLITIQLLGFNTVIQKRRSKKLAMRKILQSDDKQIINFD